MTKAGYSLVNDCFFVKLFNLPRANIIGQKRFAKGWFPLRSGKVFKNRSADPFGWIGKYK